jgi:hypothetical protein
METREGTVSTTSRLTSGIAWENQRIFQQGRAKAIEPFGGEGVLENP